ncbi:MAG TPA: hypothetical protein PKB10_13865, partial [Tepidisphaeraceae bacterium]|nr:hypothetical protein [Tepidisphaeraceae bacterium]
MSTDLPLIPPVELQSTPRHTPPRGINPLFLISAVCMLAGLFTLNSAYSNEPLRTEHLLRLILTLGMYELMLVAAGWVLYRIGAVRDALTLFVIEIVFLADLAMLAEGVHPVSLERAIPAVPGGRAL